MPAKPALLRVAVAVLAWCAASAQAADLETAGASQCTVRGFSTDPDPNGTNMRSTRVRMRR